MLDGTIWQISYIYTVSAYAKYNFGVSVNIGEEIFGKYVGHD